MTRAEAMREEQDMQEALQSSKQHPAVPVFPSGVCPSEYSTFRGTLPSLPTTELATSSRSAHFPSSLPRPHQQDPIRTSPSVLHAARSESDILSFTDSSNALPTAPQDSMILDDSEGEGPSLVSSRRATENRAALPLSLAGPAVHKTLVSAHTSSSVPSDPVAKSSARKDSRTSSGKNMLSAEFIEDSDDGEPTRSYPLRARSRSKSVTAPQPALKTVQSAYELDGSTDAIDTSLLISSPVRNHAAARRERSTSARTELDDQHFWGVVQDVLAKQDDDDDDFETGGKKKKAKAKVKAKKEKVVKPKAAAKPRAKAAPNKSRKSTTTVSDTPEPRFEVVVVVPATGGGGKRARSPEADELSQPVVAQRRKTPAQEKVVEVVAQAEEGPAPSTIDESDPQPSPVKKPPRKKAARVIIADSDADDGGSSAINTEDEMPSPVKKPKAKKAKAKISHPIASPVSTEEPQELGREDFKEETSVALHAPGRGGDISDSESAVKENVVPVAGPSKGTPIGAASKLASAAFRPPSAHVTPKPLKGLAKVIARVGIYGSRAPGLSSSSKVPRLHTHLKERPPEPKALPKEKAKPKKKGEEDYSDEEKPFHETKDYEDWDSDEREQWVAISRRKERGY